KENQAEAGYEEIHKALLTGLLSNIGLKSGGKERDYLGARNSRFLIFPGSGLFKKSPKWVMAAELVETTKLYARTVGLVRPEWIESVAGHLIKRSYAEPHWQKGRGQVGAYEKVTLFGLTLIPRRKVNYGPINPEEAREIFIRFALVERDFETRAPFWRHNRELLEYVDSLEQKARRRDLLVDEQVIYEYYDKRIPEGIYSTPQFEKWLRKATSKQSKLLHMRLEDLLRKEESGVSVEAYPDTLNVNGMELPLVYHFEPGDKHDGVTLQVPRTVINQIPEAMCEWLVPGLLRERVIALIRSLPKNLRRSFVPVPDYADACIKAMVPGDKPLIQALSEQLKKMTGTYIPEDAWQLDAVPEYLRMRFNVLGDNGRSIAQGKELTSLKKRYGSQAEGASYHSLSNTGIEREGIKSWDFDQLPESVEIKRGSIKLKGFPALVDEGESVSIQVLDSQENALRESHEGIRRLLMLSLAKDMRYLRRNLNQIEKLRLQYAKAPTAPEGIQLKGRLDIEWELVMLIVDQTFILDQPVITTKRLFEQRIEACKGQLMTHANETSTLVVEILESYQAVRKKLSQATQINWMHTVADLKEQLDQLVYKGFLQHTPYQHLKHYPRYLKAMAKRIEKLAHAFPRDKERMGEMAELYKKWQAREESYRKTGRTDTRIEEIRWALQELRVSLFAQELGTAYPVSVKRLEKRWMELGL
ncbi:MAG: ATP-dependent RNA helicase HrpA, partial [Chromatiales bacterium]|nr:ATP-dependent RNA helicase HrpA [Chromatiales bacterium]